MWLPVVFFKLLEVVTSLTVDEIYCNRRECGRSTPYTRFFFHAFARMNMCIPIAWLKNVSTSAPWSYHPCLHVGVCPRCLVVVLPLCLSLIFDHLRDIFFPADFGGSGDSCVDHETRYMALGSTQWRRTRLCLGIRRMVCQLNWRFLNLSYWIVLHEAHCMDGISPFESCQPPDACSFGSWLHTVNWIKSSNQKVPTRTSSMKENRESAAERSVPTPSRRRKGPPVCRDPSATLEQRCVRKLA